MAAIYLLILITCFIQIAFYLTIFSRLLNHDNGPTKLNIDSCKPVSIVICARNEARNLKKFLPVILEQLYPVFEVIVVDDGSLDNTPKLLEQFEREYPQLLSFRIEPEEKEHGGKKHALQHGVALAKYNWILVTDGDCCPSSNHWIFHMTQPLFYQADIVLGVSPFFRGKGIWNAYFRAEAAFIAMQYVGFALSGMPYMGVGRNMAYKREIFERHDVRKHWDLLSGDDDLFVNEMSNGSNIAVCTHSDAFTFTEAPLTPAKWFRQKMRHYTTGYRYNLIQKIWLAYYWSSSLLLFLSIPVIGWMLLRGLPYSTFLATMTGIALLIRWGITSLSFRKLAQHNMWWSVPILDLCYILSVWVLSPLSGMIRKRWK